jgi:hypothetical protein
MGCGTKEDAGREKKRERVGETESVPGKDVKKARNSFSAALAGCVLTRR